jgi:hypothetical protein
MSSGDSGIKISGDDGTIGKTPGLIKGPNRS